MPMKKSSEGPGCTFSMRKGTIGVCRLAAQATSRLTMPEFLALLERSRTSADAPSRAERSASSHIVPALMSRCAMKQRMPAASRPTQTASAAVLSAEEKLMKTYCSLLVVKPRSVKILS